MTREVRNAKTGAVIGTIRTTDDGRYEASWLHTWGRRNVELHVTMDSAVSAMFTNHERQRAEP